MLALRYAYVLALAIWLGGMVVLGAVVAPGTFQTLQAADPVNGRLLAGETFGALLAQFHFVAYGAVLLLAMAGMALLGPRPRSFATRFGLIAVMVGIALYSGLIVLREVDVIQHAVGGLPSRLAADDPRRVRFDELHQLSTRLMMLNIVGALVLVYWEARDHADR